MVERGAGLPMETFRKAPVNNTLIVLNIIVFVLTEITGGSQDTNNMLSWGAMYVPFIIEKQEYYRVLTSIFLHFGMAHLANNMLVQFVLGDYLERSIGKIKYLFLYLLGGVGGNLISGYLELQSGSFAVSVGASGAVFAVMGGLISVVLINRGHLEDLTTKKLLVMAGFSLYFGFTSTGVDNAAHIGGLLCGFVFALLFYRRKKHSCLEL
ncbi:MAG: rhomboid family intramembrane serine protease [Blautia sp.]